MPSAECSICAEDFSNTSAGDVIVTTCGHVFHLCCLSHWLSQSTDSVDVQHGSCPECRQQIALEHCRKVFFNFVGIEEHLLTNHLYGQLENQTTKYNKAVEQLARLKHELRKQVDKNDRLTVKYEKYKNESKACRCKPRLTTYDGRRLRTDAGDVTIASVDGRFPNVFSSQTIQHPSGQTYLIPSLGTVTSAQALSIQARHQTLAARTMQLPMLQNHLAGSSYTLHPSSIAQMSYNSSQAIQTTAAIQSMQATQQNNVAHIAHAAQSSTALQRMEPSLQPMYVAQAAETSQSTHANQENQLTHQAAHAGPYTVQAYQSQPNLPQQMERSQQIFANQQISFENGNVPCLDQYRQNQYVWNMFP